MSKQREALKLALEALEQYGTSSLNKEDAYSAAIKTIREALAEPEQDPVAYVDKNYGIMRINDGIDLPIGAKLYTAPPARKPLTDYQIREIDELVWKELSYEEKTFGQFALKMAKAIERAHGIGEA